MKVSHNVGHKNFIKHKYWILVLSYSNDLKKWRCLCGWNYPLTQVFLKFSVYTKTKMKLLQVLRQNFFPQFQNQAKKDFVISRKNVQTTRQLPVAKRPKFVVTFQKLEVWILCCKFFGSIQLWENLAMLLGSHKKLQKVKIYARRATFGLGYTCRL